MPDPACGLRVRLAQIRNDRALYRFVITPSPPRELWIGTEYLDALMLREINGELVLDGNPQGYRQFKRLNNPRDLAFASAVVTDLHIGRQTPDSN